MAYDIGPKIGIDGEKQFRDELTNITQQLKTLGTEMKAVTSEFDDNDESQEKLSAQSKVLVKQLELQEQKVDKLKEGLEKATKEWGENDTRTMQWAATVNNATADLNKMRRQLEKTQDAMGDVGGETDDLRKDLDKLGDAAEDSSGGFGGFLGGLDDLGGLLKGGAIVGGITAVTGAITGLVEETKEYRQIMGTLETSSAAAGYTTEQTAEAYGRLQGVLGDTQTAATATANLQAIGLSQAELIGIIDACTGAWATYGDSIPIDGLSESVNETIKAGQVTGTFADVLNWGAAEGETYGIKLRESNEANKEWNDAVNDCKTAEDYFNLALSQCSTQAERADLVMQAMAKQGLAQTGQAYRDNNEDLIELNESQAELDEAMGRLGELVTPLKTDLVNLAADGLGFLTEKVQSAVSWFKKLNDKLNQTAGNAKKTKVDVPKYSPQEAMDGYHKGGLRRVPFDGYRAVLHYNERVLTSAEAPALDSLNASIRTVEMLRAEMAAGLYNGPVVDRSRGAHSNFGAASGTQIPVKIVVQSVLDGRVIGETVTDYQLRTGKAVGR